jgi:hypothetical protein
MYKPIQKKTEVFCGCRYFLNEDLLSRVPSLFYLLAAIFTVMQVVGVLLLREPTESELR